MSVVALEREISRDLPVPFTHRPRDAAEADA